MDKRLFTYRIPLILTGILIWEFIFWITFFGFLLMLGYFSYSNIGPQMGFKNEGALPFLLLILPLNLVFLWFISGKNKRFSAIGNSHIQSIILSPISSLQAFLKYFFFRNTVAFVILAMAQPVFGTKKVTGTVESLELIVTLDISTSMNVKDIDDKVSRLGIAKRAMAQLINNLHGEKLGVVVFAGDAFAQLPLTMDYDAAKMFVGEIETGMISNQGTNIASALQVAQKMFTKTKSSRAIILISDAEDHEGGIDVFLRQLKEKEIELSVLGLGTANGGLIPNNPDQPEFGYKLSPAGTPIVSKMNPDLVKSLAAKSSGTYLISESAYPDLTTLLENLKRMKRTKVKTISFDVKQNIYQFPLLLAIISWILFLVLPQKLNRSMEILQRKTSKN
jgi:Ca-activated chloride channel family protein